MTPSPGPNSPWPPAIERLFAKARPGRLLVFGLAYGLLALLGLVWSTPHGAASAVWPAAGLGLVGARLGGWRWALPILPATWLAVFLSRGDHAAAVEFAVANTVAALIGAAALRGEAVSALRLRTLRDVARLLRAAALGAAAGALAGVFGLYLQGAAPHVDVAWAAAMWWVGDFLGVLLVAPAVCAWLDIDAEPAEAPSWPTFAAAGLTLGVAAGVFLPLGPWSQVWLIYPPLLWLTVHGRVRHLGVVLTLVVIIAVWGTTLRLGPFAPLTRHAAVLELQLFLAITLLAVYLLSTALAERRRGLADLAERARALEASVNDLEAFAYTVSHDLRRPLRSVHAFAECILEDHGDRLPEDARTDLGRITQAAERMGQLIEDLLAFSRLQGHVLSCVPCDLAALAREVVAGLRAAEPGRTVEVVLPETLPVEGDPALLRVVLENLLGNAWKYSAKTATARIEFGCRPAPEPPTFFVRDNGTGFDLENARTLFRPFQRFHDPREFEGNGIGLATVARIIDRHGGRIRAESSPGAGATFYFTLTGATVGPGATPLRT